MKEITFNPDTINLKKRFPNYIKPRVFEVCFFFIIVFTSFVAVLNGEYSNGYIENPTPNTVINLYRTCNFNKGIFENCVSNPSNTLKKICGGDCPEFLQPYEIIGTKPIFSFKKYLFGVFSFIVLAFLVNHIIWGVKNRRK